MDNIIDLARVENITSLPNSIKIPSTSTNLNTLYFSTSVNHLSAKFIWNINGSILEIYSFDHKCRNRLIGFFDFSEIFNDPSIAISLVIRLVDRFEIASKFRHAHKLIVVLSLTNSRSYICIVDVRLNNLINTIDFPFNITSAEVVLSGTPENAEKWPLIRELACMNGILAVGCDGGLVFFIDLILDSYSPVPLVPKQVSIFTCNSAHIDLINKRRTAIFHNQVICVPLNTDAKSKAKFNYRSNDGKVLASFLTSQVYVTALYYIPQLSVMCVGYNFGGFHLYNLNQFNMECHCELDSELLPTVSFAFQSPENDPKNYSYLWVVKGISAKTPNVEEIAFKSCSTAFIYLLCYENKEYINSYGILYNTFKLCCCKFEFPLTSNPYDKNSHLACSSKFLEMFTIHQVFSLRLADDENSPIDYNLFFLSWQTKLENGQSNYHFLIFDLNQWYKTQMPKCFCVDDGGLCPFISVYSLNKLSKIFAPESIQSIYFHNNSISKFSSNSFYLDIHSYPSSLSFNLTISSQTKVCNVSYFGFQKQLISQFIKTGPSLLINPEDILIKCFQYGLILPEHFAAINDLSTDVVVKRELLMNVALENNCSSFIINVIKEWSSGEYANLNCNLKHILNWIWKKVSVIKESIDYLTKSLFDFSGCNLSQQDIAKLVSHEADLASLTILLKQLQLNSTLLTKQGFDELVTRREVVELLRHYLKIILLFEEFNLLPEQDPKSHSSENTFSYCYENLSKFYSKRRSDFISINPTLFKNQDILLIDIIIRHMDQSDSLWDKNASNGVSCTGLYPPPNIHSLIRIFLIESIPLVYKEAVLLYFLLDFCDYLSDHIYAAQKILIFISSLNINQGIRNFIQGLWFLDHQNYDTALQFLTHPMVTYSLIDFKTNIVMFNEVMQRVVELFLFENEYKNALIFAQSCGNFLLDTDQNENLYIQMLLLNDNLTSAFEFQRQRRSKSNSYQVLYKLFFVCEKTNALVKICKIPLDSFEEKVFIDYLMSSKNDNSKTILILYLIINNKPLEAINIVKEYEEEFNFGQNKNILNLIQAYASVLPHSLMNLADEISDVLMKNSTADPSVNNFASNSAEFTTIKIKPKQQNVVKFSSSNSIERMLEANESRCQESTLNNSRFQSTNSRVRKSPLYLSPSVSKSHPKITKAKTQHVSKDLYSMLKLPDIKRKIGAAKSESLAQSMPSSILKPAVVSNNVEFDKISEGQKLKVSFSLIKKPKAKETISTNGVPELTTMIKRHNNDEESENSIIGQNSLVDFNQANNEINAEDASQDNQSTTSDDDKKSRNLQLNKKPMVDTPTHRMKLRSKKTDNL